MTTGSQQGLDLVARVLLDPGDVVLVELPTYTGAITAFSNQQGRLVGVGQDQDGIDIDDLDSAEWIGIGTAGSEVPGITEVGKYVVKLVDNPHPRRGQTAQAAVEVQVEDGVLRLVGCAPFS